MDFNATSPVKHGYVLALSLPIVSVVDYDVYPSKILFLFYVPSSCQDIYQEFRSYFASYSDDYFPAQLYYFKRKDQA